MGPIDFLIAAIVMIALGAIPMDDLVGIHTPWPWRILVWIFWPVGLSVMGLLLLVTRLVDSLDAD
jgi:hypothetical protein